MTEASKRGFYCTRLTVEVLHEEPLPDDLSLQELAQEADTGTYSLATYNWRTAVLTAKQAAKALIKQGSDPEFFRLNEDGSDMED